jgi:sugar phosphate isomerase/epimerase
MQFGIFAKTFAGVTAGEVLPQVKAAGFGVAQYNFACSGLSAMPDEVPVEVLAEMRRAVAASGVQLCAVSATYNMIHPDIVVREQGHQRLAVAMKAAKDCGIPVVTLCTGTRDADDQWRWHPENGSDAAWRDLLESMARAVSLAETYNVMLGIEPELANAVDGAAKAQRLIDEMRSARIKIVLDPANLFETGEQKKIVSHAFDLLAPHIIMTHAKDRLADGNFATAGQGVLDYGHVMRVIKSLGLDVPMITHGLSAKEAPGVAEFLKQQWAAA